nr:multidrug resistance efflux transporter family protein [uncultured Cetobacterium sp.]
MNGFILGIISALFFSITFILNEYISSTQGNFLWTASLRYFFMLPILFLILLSKRQIKEVLQCIKEAPLKWIIWSTVGFGLFYVPLCFAANYGQGWLVASTWQITIITGALMTPFISKEKVPMTFLKLSTIILLGIAIIQFENFKAISFKDGLYGIIPVLIAAFAYPLGNRKMMLIVKNRLTSTQRVFGMTLCSLPFWFIVSLVGFHTSGAPSTNQVLSSVLVAIFSGVIATTIFFKATDIVKHNPHKLAIVEATQATEIIFTILGGAILGSNLPSSFSIIGIGIIILGIVLSNIKSA